MWACVTEGALRGLALGLPMALAFLLLVLASWLCLQWYRFTRQLFTLWRRLLVGNETDPTVT
jgi:hypothetical protein